MSDTYGAPETEFDPSSFIMNERRRATSSAMQSLDDDPEKAARAQELADSTGDHPALVYGNLENYEAQHKASLTAQLLSSNQYLRQYVDDHPLAAKISNDDYGQLDAVTQALKKTGFVDVPGIGPVPTTADDSGALARTFAAFKEGYGQEPMLAHTMSDIPAPYNELATNVYNSLVPVDRAMRLFSASIYGASAGIGELYKMAGGNEAEANRLMRDLIEIPQVAFPELIGPHVPPELQALAKQATEVTQAAKPYLDAGVRPSVGTHPYLDDIIIKESKRDLSAIEEAFAEAQKSATRERNPEIFANFIRQHTNAKIGVSADAVARLYGDKPVTPDSPLGFIPDLAEQLEAARDSGGDIQIPLADWLAKVDPDVAKQLSDDLRVRPGGVTKVEAEALREQVATQKAMVEAYHGSPHDFEAFSMEKIGTGEGAQSYGHGLYFAEKQDVAKSYARLTPDSAKFDADNPYQTGGPLYKVRIHADKEQFLDWDKPYEEQPKGVQDAFQRLARENPEIARRFETLTKGGVLQNKPVPNPSGADLYSVIGRGVAKGTAGADKAASQALREAGIPGIKYLDQGSRPLASEIASLERTAAGLTDTPIQRQAVEEAKKRLEQFKQQAQTHNFVLFDDSLIEITHKNDQAVESLRKASALDPLFDRPEESIQAPYNRGWEWTNDAGVTAKIVPTEKMSAREKVLEQKANEVFARVAGVKGYEVGAADVINFHGEVVNGVYNSYAKGLPVILYSLHAENVPKTVRHEAIHFLHDYNFFSKGEWATLEQEALAKDWIRKHGIDRRYSEIHTDKAAMIEEAIAEEFGEWGSQHGRLDEMKEKYSEGVQAVFEKMWEFFRQIEQAIKETFGHSPAVEELFEKVESGRVAARGPGPPSHGGMDIRGKAQKGPSEPELPMEGTTRMEHRPAFDAGTYPGLTKRQSEIISRRIAERNAEDAKAQADRVVKDEQKRQSAEWKSNRETLRTEVASEIENRPDIAADRLLRTGELYGDRIGETKLATEALTEEQRAALPKDYVGRGGVHPDDLAGLFGYATGDALVDGLSRLTKGREASGMKPGDYVKRIVDVETDRQMEAKYGDLGENVLSAAKDHILSETQLDLLHDETLVLAEKAGQALPIKKDALKAQLRESLSKLAIEDINSDKMLAAAGKAGRAAEDAWIKQDYAEALKAKQQQTYAMHMAKLQAAVEKAKDQWDRTAKKFSKREVAGVSPEYTNFIHSMLMRMDEQVRRTPEDLAEEIDHGTYKTFPDFVAAKEADLRDLHVPDFLLDPAFRKPVDKLTTQEFEQVHDALKAMEFNGRNELTIERQGEKADLKEVIDAMVEKIASVGEVKKYPVDRKPNWYVDRAKSWWWSGVNVESMLNRLDRDSPRGIFYQYIARQFTDASNHKDRLIRDFQKKMSELGKIPDLDKKVENSLFRDPNTWEKDEQGKAIPGTGDLLTFRRRNVLGILQNVGNKSNLTKLAQGYGLEPRQVVDWLKSVTTKDDWDRAQKIGDTFAELFEMANQMSRRISGVGIQRLPLEELTSPHGDTYSGWYNPVRYDPIRPGNSRALIGRDVEEEGFFRATTPQGYTQQRTGYIAPVELNMDIVPVRMKQMIHDIAMRETVQQLSKVFYNPDFNRAMIKHYGKHQAASFVPFLRDIANASNFRSMEQYMGDSALEHFRQNTIATLIGLNPSTVLKHGPTALVNSLTEVGVANWGREFATLLNTDEATSKSNWRMAMEKSEELSRRMRNYSELISGHGREINIKGAQGGFDSVREFLISAGATPVSISDLLSAVPTFLAKYKSEIAAGTDEGMAVSIANRAVRRAHGSSVLSNKPSIARNNNAIGAYFSSLYGFFSHMQQKQYELAWKAQDLLKGEKSGDTDTMRHAPDLLKGFISYIVFPALVEELVTPYSNSEKESWGHKAANTLALGISSSFIGVRDFVRALVNVRDPQAGLIGTTYKMGTDIARDFRKGPQIFNKAEAGNLIKHTFALVGMLTGLTNAQEGRSAEYLHRYYQGLEKPKGPWDTAVGLRYGKTEGHSRTFEQWRKQMTGGH